MKCDNYCDHYDALKAERDAIAARLAEAERLLRLVVGDHHAPGDCYSTGPMTGNWVADLVVCPSCVAVKFLRTADSASDGAKP